MKATRIYLKIDGEIHGPYTIQEIQKHLKRGKIVGSDWARTDGMENWVPIVDLISEFKQKNQWSLGTKLLLSGSVVVVVAGIFIGLVTFVMLPEIVVFFHIGNAFAPRRQQIVRQEEVSPSAPSNFSPAVSDPTIGGSKEHSVLVADYGCDTEDDWLATLVAREICAQVYSGISPGKPIPADLFGARGYCQNAPEIELSASAWPSGSQDLHTKMTYIWDPAAYASFARQLLPAAAKLDSSAQEPTQMMTDLLDLNGQNLAQHDLALSKALQADPFNPEIQSEAALLLCALMLREDARDYSDIRQLLCRATAHLAMAQGLSPDHPGWNYRIADTALKIFAQREADSLAQISDLSARADCPPSAKIWLNCLKMWILEDWRVFQPDSSSSPMEKTVWTHWLNLDLQSTLAVYRIKKSGLSIEPLDLGRAVCASGRISAENGLLYGENTMNLEISEIGAIDGLEHGDPYTDDSLQERLSEPEAGTVTNGPRGPEFHVIGLPSFQNATRRHLCIEVSTTANWLYEVKEDQDAYSAFESRVASKFGHMQGLDYDASSQDYLANLKTLHDTVNISQMPVRDINSQFSGDSPEVKVYTEFYRPGLPYGTAYEAYVRAAEFLNIGNEFQGAIDPSHPALTLFKNGTFLSWLNLHPSNFDLRNYLRYANTVYGEELAQQYTPYLDYNLRAFDPLVTTTLNPKFDVPDPMIEQLFKKEVALFPDANLEFGDYYVKRGLTDQAAAAYREAFTQGIDQYRISNNINWLVKYDLDHNNLDEAKKLSDQGVAIGSKGGLTTEFEVATKLDQVDVAEQVAQKILGQYQDDRFLHILYHVKANHFPGKYDELIATEFPQGLQKVTFDSYRNNKTVPSSGVLVQDNGNPHADPAIYNNDVIVALNGIRTDTHAQYNLVRDEMDDDRMELIIWRYGHYEQLVVNPPDRMLGADLMDVQGQ